MRELFEEVAGKSPLDAGGGGPAHHARAAPQAFLCPCRRRRIARWICRYARRQTDPHAVRARSGGADPKIAAAMSAEWDAQKEIIDPLTMPLTRFANSVVDAVIDRVDAVADDVAKYLGSDLLFYRAGHPEALVAREAALWDPVLFWAADALGAHFILAEGIVHVRQPDSADCGGAQDFSADPWSIAALHMVTTLTGSALLALALMHGVLDQDQVWTAAHVDEDWNIEQWGVDEEVAARRATRQVDFRAAARILKAAESSGIG